MKKLTSQQQFFYDNAGFSYDPKTETADEGRRRCAVKMARAENWARDTCAWYQWELETDSDCGCETRCEEGGDERIMTMKSL